ncbi:Protein of unknown function [Pyronema omphalodes CBS 100304]|uniref:Uncharacterized protein n=1 Tax=Pyronema omphalodes (strain CBS 100304) TaxID=1076935 RepID=U4LRZ9_PYROM|nr:Protein of unknown function [Pyronema omphalodes CBS 100304]
MIQPILLISKLCYATSNKPVNLLPKHNTLL